MSEVEKPYWYPDRVDTNWFARMRKDYPERAHLSDDELAEYFEVDGSKYTNLTVWDHAGDAYEDFEPLADDWFARGDEIEQLRAVLEEIGKHKTYAEMDRLARANTDSMNGHDYFIQIARAALHPETKEKAK